MVPGVDRAYVNNGGDIALLLKENQSWRIGVVSDLQHALLTGVTSELISDSHFVIHHDMPVRGVATSGWQGRSFSLGIADSVTVLAATAAQADGQARGGRRSGARQIGQNHRGSGRCHEAAGQ